MIEQTVRDAKQKMQTVIDALRDQLKTLQLGRATSALVDDIQVEYYGSKMPLKQVGSVTIPEPNQLVITPWDKGALAPIETAIRDSDLGINPVNDGKAIRIVLPPLTEERRRDMSKIVGKMAEEARIALRNVRHDSWEAVQAAEKAGSITEDDEKRGRDELDKLIDTMNSDVEKLAKDKERDIMSV